jgi:K+-transporting ATPase KdpF subunit
MAVRENQDLGGASMDGIYMIGAAVSALLFVYLVIALLKPEWFA